MSLSQYRRDLASKQKSKADREKKAADLRNKESRKRIEATKAKEAASKTSSLGTARMKLRSASQAEEAANNFGKQASELEAKAAKDGSDAAALQMKIGKAEMEESRRAIRKQALAAQAAQIEQRSLTMGVEAAQHRIAVAEEKADQALRALATPKAEKLRILMLGASPEGDLRVTREHTRIRKAVEAAAHRDLVEIDVRLSATPHDLLEGIAKFRPHVVHFSGHGDDQLVTFEEDRDDFHEDGIVVTASAFAAACAATDQPPTLVVLNACHSVGTAAAVVERFAPLAIGMTGSILDADALTYAAALYSSIANGHSVESAHMAGRAAVELLGGEHELSRLFETPDVNASMVILVKPLIGP